MRQLVKWPCDMEGRCNQTIFKQTNFCDLVRAHALDSIHILKLSACFAILILWKASKTFGARKLMLSRKNQSGGKGQDWPFLGTNWVFKKDPKAKNVRWKSFVGWRSNYEGCTKGYRGILSERPMLSRKHLLLLLICFHKLGVWGVWMSGANECSVLLNAYFIN